MTLLRLEPSHEVAVLEMSMYTVGEIARLAEIAAPEVGVVLAVHPTHLERAGSIERIARAKAELPGRAARATGWPSSTPTTPRVRRHARRDRARERATFGLGADADVRADDDRRAAASAGTEFTLHAPWGDAPPPQRHPGPPPRAARARRGRRGGVARRCRSTRSRPALEAGSRRRAPHGDRRRRIRRDARRRHLQRLAGQRRRRPRLPGRDAAGRRPPSASRCSATCSSSAPTRSGCTARSAARAAARARRRSSRSVRAAAGSPRRHAPRARRASSTADDAEEAALTSSSASWRPGRATSCCSRRRAASASTARSTLLAGGVGMDLVADRGRPAARLRRMVLLAPIYISLLQRLGFGKQIRIDGPEAHYGKAGTPTMGGMLIVGVVLFLAMALRIEDAATLTPMLTLMGVGILGAIDDFVNVRTGIGMRGRWKLVWQTIVAHPRRLLHPAPLRPDRHQHPVPRPVRGRCRSCSSASSPSSSSAPATR